MPGMNESSWGQVMEDEPLMLGANEATWRPYTDVEEEPKLLGEKESSWGPPLGSNEPRVPIIKAEEKPSPFFFSSNPSFHKNSHPVARAAKPAKKEKGFFGGFFDKLEKNLKKVEKPAS